MVEARIHARVALALASETFVPADEQRRLIVELDAVDRGQQRDDRERVRDEVRDDAYVGRRADQRLLFEDLDPYLFDAVQEVAQRPLLGQQQLQQSDLEFEVVVISGHDLDPAGRGLEELAIFLGRRAQRFFDQAPRR